MASLYKKPVIRTDPATGQKIKAKSKKWWGQYKDALGRLRRVPLAIDKVAAQAMLTGAAITLDMARDVLADAVSQTPQEVTVNQIMDVVTRHFSIRIADLQGKKRTQSVALPRQICMHLARVLTRHSLEEIGGYFGGRDHTTLLHADRKIADELKTNAELRATIDALTSAIRNDTPRAHGDL